MQRKFGSFSSNFLGDQKKESGIVEFSALDDDCKPEDESEKIPTVVKEETELFTSSNWSSSFENSLSGSEDGDGEEEILVESRDKNSISSHSSFDQSQ